MISAVLSLLAVGIGLQPPQKLSNDLSPADRKEIEREVREVGSYDRKAMLKEDLSKAAAAKAGTETLIEHSVRPQHFQVFSLYDDPNVGVYRAYLSSHVLQELVKRKDAGPGFLGFFAHFELDPAKSKRYHDRGELSISFMGAELLLQYPAILRNCHGFEKGLISALAKAYDRMKAIDKGLPVEKLVFGGELYRSTGSTALKLLTRLEGREDARLEGFARSEQWDDVFRELRSRFKGRS